LNTSIQLFDLFSQFLRHQTMVQIYADDAII